MGYQYDAFFSYKRDPESDGWHERVSVKLTHWVQQGLQREVRIFFDREDIRTGMRWRQKLSNALKESRCIVCVWSPLYFRSKWCVSEWKTFAEREKQVNRELVLPASYFDGKTFPDDATATQFMDFSSFASTIPSFWDTQLAVRFEMERLQPFASDLAAMIRNAPPFDDRFPIVEASDAQLKQEETINRIADA